MGRTTPPPRWIGRIEPDGPSAPSGDGARETAAAFMAATIGIGGPPLQSLRRLRRMRSFGAFRSLWSGDFDGTATTIPSLASVGAAARAFVSTAFQPRDPDPW